MTQDAASKVSQIVTSAKSAVTEKMKDSMTTETSSADLSGDDFD